MNNEFQTVINPSLFSAEPWAYSGCKTLAIEDIRSPWKSVYGFAMGAARLAAGQPLVLCCREDEIFEQVTKLNELLGQPAVLARAFARLAALKGASEQKLNQLFELEERPLAEEDISEIVKTVEQFLTASGSAQTLLSRLEEMLRPQRAGDQKVGLQKMVGRLEKLMAALTMVKERGFRSSVYDRRRQPAYPALNARRNEPIMRNGQPSGLTAGFLLPVQYHLTLWSYVIIRDDHGQSRVWN